MKGTQTFQKKTPATTVNVTLASGSWDANDEYTISNAGIETTKKLTLTYDPSMSDSDYEVLQKAGIRPTAVSSGSMTLKAMNGAPASNLDIILLIEEM